MKKNHWAPLLKSKGAKLLLCMKFLTLFILLTITQVSASVNAQGKKIDLHLKNSTMVEVINRIKGQSEFTFLYNIEDINTIKELNIEFKQKDIFQILDSCLKGSKMTYEVKDKVVILKPVIKTVVEKAPVVQDKITITGIVTDDKKLPLPGVSVLQKGTTNGVSTDIDGKYTIKVPQGKNIVLVFSFIGMQNQEIVVNNQKTLNVVLKGSSEKLDEIVVKVSTGFQKIDRKLFTGSAAKVDAEAAKVDGVADVSQMLEGKAAGVSVQSVSGTFGAAPKIRVRGASSIYGTQKPLWVIDGVVLEDVVDVSPDQLSSGDAATLISSAVAGLNADDIENFQILKDASATALYGARAMNGVIVITTKKGKKGKLAFNYSSEYTYRLKPSYTDYNIMNSQDQMSVYLEMYDKGWLNYGSVSRASNAGPFAIMADLISNYYPERGFIVQNTPEGKANFLRKYEMANTDWCDLLFKNSIIQNHSISFSSGNERSSNYMSMSFYDDPGFSISDKVSRFTGNFKSTYNVLPNLSVGFSAVGSIREQKAPGTLNRTDDVVNGSFSRDFDINPFSFALNTSRAILANDENGNFRRNYAPFSIFEETKRNYLDLDILDLKFQFNLSYEIIKGLNYDFVGSMRYVKSTQEHKINEKSNLAEAYRQADNQIEIASNPFLFRDVENPNKLATVVLPKGGFYKTKDNKLTSFYIRNTLNWNKMFDSTHSVNVLLGQDLNYADRKLRQFNGVGFQYNRGGVPFVDYRFIQKMLQQGENYYGMAESFDRSLAYFTTASYSYMGKYTFNGTYRYDGSNRLGKSRAARWLPTWNVSGAWNAHAEEFMKEIDFISYLKLRATYGLTASMGAASNSEVVYRNTVTNTPYANDKQSQIFISALQNSDLTWEKQYETNVGIDLGLFNNKINIQLDAYQRKGFDLIGWVKGDGVGGKTWKFANYADMKSQGLEFTLSTKTMDKKEFKWNTNLTFAYNKNEITNLKSFPQVYGLVQPAGGAKEGYPVRGLFSFDFKGLNQYGRPTLVNEKGEISDSSFNFQSDQTDHLKYEGSVDPKFTGGLTNTFKYKNWRLNTFISYQLGNKIRLNPSFSAYYSDTQASPKELRDRWVLPGDEKHTNIPTIITSKSYQSGYVTAYNAYNLSTARIADGSFAKLKEVSLTYDLPKTFLKKYKLSKLQLKLQATNLFILYSDSKLNGQDPEFNFSGGVAMPVPKQYTLTLKLGI